MEWVYIWLAITAGALVLEFLTAELVSIWFVGGGLVSLLLAGIGLDWYFHVPAFILVSLALMFCLRRVAMKKFNKSAEKTNAETVIGKDFVLLKNIAFNNAGEIKVNGVTWTAVAENENTEIKAGAKVVVKKLVGNKYIVEEIK